MNRARPPLVLVAGLLVGAVAACSSPESRLDGQWAIDIDRTLQLPGFVEIPEAQREPARRTATRLLGSVRIRFDREGAFTWTAAGLERPGQYSVEQRAGRRWVLKVRFDDAEDVSTMIAEWREDGLALEVGEDRWALRRLDDQAGAADGP